MIADLSRRSVLGAALAAPLTFPAPAIEPPAWEADATAKLAVASALRRTAANRLNSGRDLMMRWERRNPFPTGQGAGARHEWAQAYCTAFTAAEMSQRVAARDSARAVCEALCRDVVALAGNALADRQALSRLLPYDAADILKGALLARAVI